jgi:hypothetical protein
MSSQAISTIFVVGGIGARHPDRDLVADGKYSGQGAVPHVALDDCGYYVRWLFDHPRLSASYIDTRRRRSIGQHGKNRRQRGSSWQ